MLKLLHKVSVYLLIALGAVHTLLTPVFNKELSVEAMYFASAGLAMVVIGFLNIAMSRSADKDRVTVVLCYIANVLFSIFGLLTVLALREPQAYVGLGLLLTITITSFWYGKTK
jgi:ribose/xylose/arabinose/galactoside ABC-type transport system permease subunit